MKIFIVIFAIFTVVHADTIKDKWQPKTSAELKSIREECVKSYPLAQDEITKMLQFEYPDEESVRKYLLCSVKKINIFCACKGYNAARVAKQFDVDASEEALYIIKDCSDKNKDDSSIDVWVYRGFKCLINSKVGESMKTFIRKAQTESA